MALVFNSTIGQASAFRIQGASPVKRIDLGVTVNRSKFSVIDTISDIGSWASNAAGDFIWNSVEEVSEAAKSLSEAERAIIRVSNPAIGAVLDAGAWGVLDPDPNAKKLPKYTDSQFGPGTATQREWNQRADMSISQMMEDLGIVTSIRGNFSEAAAQGGPTVEVGDTVNKGVAAISGIAFEASCDREPGRHGLEAVLEYYYHNRASNKEKPMSITHMKIGATSLDGWVVGVDWSPLNLDYRLWSWSINLFLSPVYEPQVISKDSAIAKEQAQRRAAADRAREANRAYQQAFQEGITEGLGNAASLLSFGIGV